MIPLMPLNEHSNDLAWSVYCGSCNYIDHNKVSFEAFAAIAYGFDVEPDIEPGFLNEKSAKVVLKTCLSKIDPDRVIYVNPRARKPINFVDSKLKFSQSNVFSMAYHYLYKKDAGIPIDCQASKIKAYLS